jgi:hypothetical protein
LLVCKYDFHVYHICAEYPFLQTVFNIGFNSIINSFGTKLRWYAGKMY